MAIKTTYYQFIIGILLILFSYFTLANTANNSIEDITLSIGENKERIITVKLNTANISPNIGERAGQVIVTFPNTKLPKQLQKELNVVDIASPIKAITPTINNQNTIISILPKVSNYKYSAYQVNDILVFKLWEIPPTTEKRTICEDIDKLKKVSGISLNLPDTEIRTIFKILADDKKINLVVTDSVTGKMTLRTQGMTWKQVLDIVLKTNNLDKRLERNILFIAPVEEFLASSRKLFDEEHVICAGSRPYDRKLFPINYVDAKTIVKTFEQQKPKQQERGSLAVDNRTNTIIAYQPPENFELLNKIIKENDIPATQIQLEARVVETNKNYIELIKNQLNQGEHLDLLLNKMQKEGLGEVISHPKVTTSDKEEARIVKGQETHCYINQSCSSKPTLSFTITPEIINDSQIKLSIETYMESVEKQNKSSPLKKQFERIVNNDQILILDELDDLGYPINNDNQSKLMLTITPKIVLQKSFQERL